MAEAIKHLLESAKIILTKDYQVFVDLKDGLELRDRIRKELAGLIKVLETANNVAHGQGLIWNPILRYGATTEIRFTPDVLSRLAGIVGEGEAALMRLDKRLQQANNRHRFLWSFLGKPYVDKDLKKLDWVRGEVGILLVENADVMGDTLTEADKRERGKIIDWLELQEAPSAWPALADHPSRDAMQGLIGSREYLSWFKGGRPQHLWCYGESGAGKTMISIETVHQLRESARAEHSGQQRLVLSYFFSHVALKHQQTTDVIVRQLVFQVLQSPSLTPLQVSVFGDRRKQSPPMVPPQHNDLLPLLLNVCTSYKTFLVVDGVEQSEDRPALLAVLRQLMRAGWRILVTSRDPKPELQVPDLSEIRISPTTNELRSYVENRFLLDTRFDETDPVHASVASGIAGAKGMNFLIARLIMTSLLTHSTDDEVAKAFNLALNSGNVILPQAYQYLSEMLSGRALRQGDALRVVAWITHAARPLRYPELAHALAFDLGKGQVIEQNIATVGDILESCLGMVVYDKVTDTLGLFHETAYAFFRDYKETRSPHDDIAQVSIGHLILASPSLPCQDDQALLKLHDDIPFLSYAARHWGIHAQKVESSMIDRIKAFILDPNYIFPAIRILQSGQWRNPRTDAFFMIRQLTTGQQATHAAAFWGLHRTLQILIDEGANPQAQDSDGWTPLHWAASNGQVEAVGTLLRVSTPIEADAGDQRGVTPIGWAALHGHPAAVKMLTDKGAKPLESLEELRQTLYSTFWLDRHEVPDALQLSVERSKKVDVKAMAALSQALSGMRLTDRETANVAHKGSHQNVTQAPGSDREEHLVTQADPSKGKVKGDGGPHPEGTLRALLPSPVSFINSLPSMAEIIGVASGIAGLITLATKVATIGYEYIADFKDGPALQSRLRHELQALEHLVKKFQPNAPSNLADSSRFSLSPEMKATLDPLADQYMGIFSKLQKQLESVGRPTLWNRIVWPFKKATIERHLLGIHRFRDMISSGVIDQTNERAGRLVLDRQKDEIIEWLALKDAPPVLPATTKAFCGGETDWFSTDEFVNWRDGPPSLVWCHGSPGVGKTMLMREARDRLKDDKSSPERLILYYFFNHTAPKNQQRTDVVVRQLAAQLLRQPGLLSAEQIELLGDLYRGSLGGDPPTHRVLVPVLISLCTSKKTYLLIDALDEFEDQEVLITLLREFVRSKWYIITTSRHPDNYDPPVGHRHLQITSSTEAIQEYILQCFGGRKAQILKIDSDKSLVEEIATAAGNKCVVHK
ncbi:hypothetical protein NMY22_g18429 [Coprinellus aureogranulatus]|nr:hypothetical protein NMY22_g18429 [Coprinellus aureogranulatus]